MPQPQGWWFIWTPICLGHLEVCAIYSETTVTVGVWLELGAQLLSPYEPVRHHTSRCHPATKKQSLPRKKQYPC